MGHRLDCSAPRPRGRAGVGCGVRPTPLCGGASGRGAACWRTSSGGAGYVAPCALGLAAPDGLHEGRHVGMVAMPGAEQALRRV